ncbi:MAG: hypothetical protein AAF750_13855 [Planctomycetota bacterium]
MLKLATLLRNAGEPRGESRYDRPEELSALGYTGLVMYETTALSGVSSPDDLADPELRRWVEQMLEGVQRQAEAARSAGLGVYVSYDVIVLPRDVVGRHESAVVSRHRSDVLDPTKPKALELSVKALEALLGRLPEVEGVVLRFGDTDAARLPYLMGNDIYSPPSSVGRADRVVSVLERFHELVVGRLGKRLIARAWNVNPGGLHDTPELAARVADRLPGDPGDERFVLSFKYTQTDFWRYQPWNKSSLCFGDRPILYELQCQREFEGKGGVPNWLVPVWQDGPPPEELPPEELGSGDKQGEAEWAGGLQRVGERVNWAGVMAWVRGGGWGGPFVGHEEWIDANVWSVPRLVDEPGLDAEALAGRWVDERLGVGRKPVASALTAILSESGEIARKAFYVGAYARSRSDAWHPSADYIQDDVLDVRALWRLIQRLPEAQLKSVLEEKQSAADRMSHLRGDLQLAAGDRRHRNLLPLVNSMLYTEAFYETLRDLVVGLVQYRRFTKSADPTQAYEARQRLLAAQGHWNHHTQRYGSMPGTATPFRENEFWEITQDVLAKLDGSVVAG